MPIMDRAPPTDDETRGAPVRAAHVCFAALGLAAAGTLGWRFAARRRRLPCPAWLAWILENPYTDAVAGSGTLLDRAGVGPGMRVLDAGSGPGRLTIPAAERVGPAGEVVALDVQGAMLARVRHRAAARGLLNVRTALGGIESGPGVPGVQAGTFDGALLVAVLGEVPGREAAMRALHAALKPGGVLSVTEVIPDPHYQRIRTVRRLGETAGFRLDRAYAARLAFTLNFRKPG